MRHVRSDWIGRKEKLPSRWNYVEFRALGRIVTAGEGKDARRLKSGGRYLNTRSAA